MGLVFKQKEERPDNLLVLLSHWPEFNQVRLWREGEVYNLTTCLGKRKIDIGEQQVLSINKCVSLCVFH